MNSSFLQIIEPYLFYGAWAGLTMGIVLAAYRWTRDRKKGQLVVTEYQLAGFGIILVLVGRWLFSVIPADKVPTLTGALVFSIFATQALELIRQKRLSAHITSLERAIKSKQVYQSLNRCLDHFDQIEDILKQHPKLKTFLDARLRDHLTLTQDVLAAFAKGRLKFDETLELAANKDFLEQLTEKQSDVNPEVMAVSYEDEHFWSRPEGIDFLKANAAANARGINVERIFIFQSKLESRKAEIRKIVEDQTKAKVVCWLIFKDEMENTTYCEDFVIYCGRYVRFAELTDKRDNLKQATLSCEPEFVTEYVNQYRYLRARAIAANDFYATTEPPGNA